jgi:hypothetical protein
MVGTELDSSTGVMLGVSRASRVWSCKREGDFCRGRVWLFDEEFVPKSLHNQGRSECNMAFSLAVKRTYGRAEGERHSNGMPLEWAFEKLWKVLLREP